MAEDVTEAFAVTTIQDDDDGTTPVTETIDQSERVPKKRDAEPDESTLVRRRTT